jgi:hypothetical protein
MAPRKKTAAGRTAGDAYANAFNPPKMRKVQLPPENKPLPPAALPIKEPPLVSDPWFHYCYKGMTEKQRAEIVDRMRSDPLGEGLEPPIWWVADALIDFPICTRNTADSIRGTTGMGWDAFKVEMRKAVGWDGAPARSILLDGANRSAKSEYAAKRAMMMACAPVDKTAARDERECVLGMHSQIKRTKMDQQPLFIKYLPPAWREFREGMGNRRDFEWINKGFFPQGWHKLPNGRRIDFAAYSQKVRDVLEGKIIKFANPDERFPMEWLETLEIRTAQVNGFVVATFTPVDGWTAGMGAFCDGMEILRKVPAFLLPTDGGTACPWLALGLYEREYRELEGAERENRQAEVPACRPQDCLKWLDGEEGMLTGPAGRTFGTVPRVARSANGKRAIVWFHPCDNPWGNPKSVIETCLSQGAERVKRNVYGIAQRGWGKQISNFDVSKHVVAPDAVQKVGRNFHVMDPASGRTGGEGRNSFMAWFRRVGRIVYIYREWPGRDWIAGVGVPEPWTIPSGSDRNGKGNDGSKGPAQSSWGFGLLRYKFEIARLEGWKDWNAWRKAGHEDREDVADVTDGGEVWKWLQRNGASEPIQKRMIDPRSANMGHIGIDTPVTLLDEFDKIGLMFDPARAPSIDDGVKKIIAMLEDGRLKISADCPNIIWSLQNWTNVDGQAGACKDPIDVVRMFCTSVYSDDVGPAQEPVADSRGDRHEDEPAEENPQDMKRAPQRRARGAFTMIGRRTGRIGWMSGGRPF